MKKFFLVLAMIVFSFHAYSQLGCRQIKKGWALKCGIADSLTIDSVLLRTWIETFYSSGGAGTVTNFSAGDLSPLFTTSEANTTTTPALTFNLSNASPFTVFARGSGTGAPSYQQLDTTHIANFGNKVLARIYQGLSTQFYRSDGSIATIPTNLGDFSNDVGYWVASDAVVDGGSDIQFVGTLASLSGFINNGVVLNDMIADVDWSKLLNVPIADASATNVGIATFNPNDFNDNGLGLIGLDYTNGQAADATHKGFLTAADFNIFNAKQAALVSGTNIKTVNSNSLLGSGNVAVGDALVANTLSQFASTTSAELAGVISNETGSGSLVFGTSPTLTTASLGSSTATTQTSGDNSTKVATTAYVDAQSYYTLSFTHSNSTYTSGTTYYFGAYNAATSTTTDLNYIKVPYACTLIGGSISIRGGGTLSTSGNATVSAWINNTTGVTLSSAVTIQATQQTFTVTGLSQAIAAGDRIEIKFACPTWGTASPTTVQVRVDLYFR